MPATIRQLLPDDAEAYVTVRRAALAREPFAFAASPEDDRAVSPALVRDALANPSQATFGAFAPGLVGIVGIYRDAHRKAAHKAHVWGLYVDPAHRRDGVGRALMQAALGFARTLPGVTQVHLGVSDRAGAARALYETLGFIAWATERNALRVGEDSAAEHHMTLDLDRADARP